MGSVHGFDKSVAVEKIDSEIKRLKELWLIACSAHSVEGMATNFFIIDYLIALKRDSGLISDSDYKSEIADLYSWREESYRVVEF